ncbi:MAG: hypothetical protein HRT58_08130 [Crocinitomicaceae bacterium]|nr:hypothetical protein [Flavobacteriales bacterium]NQZ35616.1 hypothetical protein [Crocinitomicaceae bacterium]
MKNYNLIFTLLVVIGFCSCNKDEFAKNERGHLTITPSEAKGGDDDDDPIVQGIVLDNDTLVVDVVTAIIPEFSETPVDVTNANGFSFQVPRGNYYLKVTQAENEPIQTEVFNVTEDISLTVNLD